MNEPPNQQDRWTCANVDIVSDDRSEVGGRVMNRSSGSRGGWKLIEEKESLSTCTR